MPTGSPADRRVTPAKCRNCNRPMNSPLFCSDCRTLHAPEGTDFFDLFGLEATYDIDVGRLRCRYLECSRDVHPDRFGSSGREAAALSVRSSAWLNEGYRVLSDPVLRAEYLLERLGGKSSAEDKGVAPEILTQTLALRERIEEARLANDAAALSEAREEVLRFHADTLTDVAILARQLPGSEEVRRQLRQTLNGIKYYQKLLERC